MKDHETSNSLTNSDAYDKSDTVVKLDREKLLAKANTLPKTPGCYLMQGKLGEILYVGKAKNLKSKKVKSSATTRKRKKSISVNDLWTEEMGKAAGKSVKYTIRETFNVGDILDHKSFGPGIVQNLVDDKIEVLFQHEIKLLVHGK